MWCKKGGPLIFTQKTTYQEEHSEKPTKAGISMKQNQFLPYEKKKSQSLLVQQVYYYSLKLQDYFCPQLLCLCLIIHHCHDRKIAAILRTRYLFRLRIPSPCDTEVKKRNANQKRCRWLCLWASGRYDYLTQLIAT